MISFLHTFKDSELATAISQSRLYDAQRLNYEASTVNQNIDDAILWFTHRKLWINTQLQTEAIHNLHNEFSEQQIPVYNLYGTQISKQTLKPDIYIKDGKKYVAK